MANCETRLHFVVRNVILRPVKLDHFMGMGGHLVLRRDDGTVFTYLHPSGSFSMAAQQLFELRAEGKPSLKIASSKNDPICKLPEFDPTMAGMPAHEDDSFTYAFAKAGAYRMWVQVKVKGEILTGVFDVNFSRRLTVIPGFNRSPRIGFPSPSKCWPRSVYGP